MYVPDKKQFIQEMSCFLGLPLSSCVVQKLKQCIVKYYQKKGFLVIGVSIPANQDITDGVLKVIINIGRLGKVKACGAKYYSDEKLASKIRIKKGEYLRKDKLLADLNWINQDPFRFCDVILEEGEEIGQTDITLCTKDCRPFRFFSGYENTGNQIAGSSRFLTGVNIGITHIMTERAVYKLNDFPIKFKGSALEIGESISNYMGSNQRKECTAKAQIHFADVLINILKDGFKFFYTKDLVEALEISIKNINDSVDETSIQKAENINQTIVDWLNPTNGSNSIKTELNLLNLDELGSENGLEYNENDEKRPIKAILPCISEFENLEVLNFNNNQITSIPSSIAKLQKIKELDLCSNKITFIPESITSLKKLQHLQLDYNKITSLPESIVSLRCLKELEIENNKITVIPNSLSHLTNYREIRNDFYNTFWR